MLVDDAFPILIGCDLIVTGLHYQLLVSRENHSRVPEHPINLNKKEVNGHNPNPWPGLSSVILCSLFIFTLRHLLPTLFSLA